MINKLDMNKASLQIGDVYTLQERETGKWFAFQIVQIGEENAVYIDLRGVKRNGKSWVPRWEG